MFKNLKISTKLIIPLLVLIGTFFLAIGYVSYNFLVAEITTRTSEDFMLAAKTKEGHIFDFLERSRERAIDFASDGFIRDSVANIIRGDKNAVEALNEHLKKNKMSLYSTIYGINITDLNGRIIASTDSSNIGMDESKDDYFIQALNKKNGDAYVSQVKISHHFQADIFSLVASSPLTDKITGEPLGVLINYIKIDELNDIMTGTQQIRLGAYSGKEGRGETLEIYLVNSDGLMMTRSRFVNNAVLNQKVDTEPVKLCIEQQKSMNGTYNNYLGTEVIGASSCIYRNGWTPVTLLVEMNTAEALAPIKSLQAAVILFSLVALTIIWLIVYFLSKKILKPLGDLRTITEKISKENLYKRIKIKSNDEIGMLGESFNKMLDRLESAHASIALEREKLTQILDSLPVPVDIVNQKREIQYINQTFLETFGNKCIGDYCYKHIKDNKQICKNCPISEAIKEKGVIKTIRVPGIAGGKTFLISHATFRDVDGEDLLVEVFRDITEEEAAQKSLEEAVKILNMNKARDEAILLSLGEGMIVVGKNENIIMINHTAEKMLQWEKNGNLGQMIIKTLEMEDESGETISPEDRPIRSAMTSGKKTFRDNIFFKRRDGSRFPVAVTTSPVMLNKHIMGAVMIFRDITKEKEIDKTKSEFISVASHQLRTPLTSIRWVIENFTKRENLTEKGKEYLDDIHNAARRLTDLVDLLLNVSRIEGGAISVSPKPVEFVEIVKSYLEESRPLIEKKRLNIKSNLPTSLDLITDGNVVRIIIQSLISNSIEYTPEEGEIELSLKKTDKDFTFMVKDTGIGIPKDEQKFIFNKFKRGTNAVLMKTDGTGLGLYITKKAVDLLEGKIWFDSEENKGTTFYVSLPLKSKPTIGKKSFV